MRPRAKWLGIAVAVAALAGGLLAALLIGPRQDAGLPSPSVQPSVPASMSQGATASSNPASIAPTLAPTPGATPRLADCLIDAQSPLAIRVEASSDIGRSWVISVYADGTVLTPGLTPAQYDPDYWMLGRRLAMAGVAHLRTEILATGLFERSSSWAPIPLPGVEPPGRGGSGYTITVGSGSASIVVSWTSLFSDDALYYQPSPERTALDALARDLVAFDQSLPAGDWTDSSPCGYRSAFFRLFTQAQAAAAGFGGVDIADVDWPLGNGILEWGDDVSRPPYDLTRCGVVPRGQASQVLDTLLSAGAVPYVGANVDGGPYLWIRLDDRSQPRIVDVYIRPMLPDESGCTNGQANPFGI